MKGVIIAGSDTGAGKTRVAMGIIRVASRLGLRVGPFKPIETGVLSVPEDASNLLEASQRLDLPLSFVCPYPLKCPVAPIVAARKESVLIELSRILEAFSTLAAKSDYLVVELAGGLLVPLSETLTNLDLAARLALPVLVVAKNSLGTVNHTALSIRALQSANVPLVGVVLSTPSPERTPDQDSNAEMIELLTGIRPIVTLPFLDQTDADSMAAAFPLGPLLVPLGLPNQQT